MTDSRDASRLDASISPASSSPHLALELAAQRLRQWRAALTAAGFRTNLSLARPASLAARPAAAPAGDDLRWVTILPSGAVALERGGACGQTWSLVAAGHPSADDIVAATRMLLHPDRDALKARARPAIRRAPPRSRA